MNTVGECVLRRERNPITGLDELHIDQADPHILVAAEVLDEAIFKPGDMLWMDYSNQQTCWDDHEHHKGECFTLCAIMHVKGVNREVLYHITPHPERTDAYVGRWPD